VAGYRFRAFDYRNRGYYRPFESATSCGFDGFDRSLCEAAEILVEGLIPAMAAFRRILIPPLPAPQSWPAQPSLPPDSQQPARDAYSYPARPLAISQ
jgi:hypothetical protein